MKIIDLLNKIANNEEVPKYVQYYNMLKNKTDIMWVYKENLFYKLDQLEIQLNSRVEVLKEKGLPEKLLFEEGKISDKEFLAKYITHNRNKINEIIDYLEKQRKGE